MPGQPDFIGIGAQKAGTSWIYACLYEHPEICLPRKEFHFFSKEEYLSKGYEWYEAQFDICSDFARAGEFSTTYLHTDATAQRISARYPDVKLLVSLRNPVDRAYSNYRNDIMAGAVSADEDFIRAFKTHPEYLAKGLYARQLKSFLNHFSRENILILIYEDCLTYPAAFIKKIYRFLDVDASYFPSMIDKKVNVGRVPLSAIFEKMLVKSSEMCQKSFLRRVWWTAKKMGLGDLIRKVTSKAPEKKLTGPDGRERQHLFSLFEEDICDLENLLGRKLEEWRKVA